MPGLEEEVLFVETLCGSEFVEACFYTPPPWWPLFGIGFA